MKKDNSGAATIIVVCVMAVFMALSMGLFLTASVLTRNAGRTLAGEQCRILAVSFSEEVAQMLTARTYEYEDRAAEEIGRAGESAGTSIWHYVKQNISDGSWSYYSEEEGGIHSKENAIREFQMSRTGDAGEVADLSLSLYWTKGVQEGRPGQLVVATTASIKEQRCTVWDIYELQAGGNGTYDKWSWKHVEKR